MTAATFSPHIYDVLRKSNRTLLFLETKDLITVKDKAKTLLLKDDSVYVFIELGFISQFFDLDFTIENQEVLIGYWKDGFMKAKFRFSKTPSITNEERNDIGLFFKNIDAKQFLMIIQKEIDRAPNRTKFFSQIPDSSVNLIATNVERLYLKSFLDPSIPL